MIKAFICEIDKQIAINKELFNQTKMVIFKQRIQNLESKKNEILSCVQTKSHISH